MCICWLQAVYLCACVYLFVHIAQAGAVDSRQRRRRWSWWLSLWGGESRCGLGSHSSDHHQFALWPLAGRELWRCSQSAHSHQSWHVNDGERRLTEESRVIMREHTTTPQLHLYMSVLQTLCCLFVCLLETCVWFLCSQHGYSSIATRWSSCEVLWVFWNAYANVLWNLVCITWFVAAQLYGWPCLWVHHFGSDSIIFLFDKI